MRGQVGIVREVACPNTVNLGYLELPYLPLSFFKIDFHFNTSFTVLDESRETRGPFPVMTL